MKKGPMDSSLMAGIWDKKFVSEFFMHRVLYLRWDGSGTLAYVGFDWYELLVVEYSSS
jgi:hypothetical protein